MPNKPAPKSVRKTHADRMVGIAEYLKHDGMTGDDVKRALDCIVEAYKATEVELPALAGWNIARIEKLPPTLANLEAEQRTVAIYIQKWS